MSDLNFFLIGKSYEADLSSRWNWLHLKDTSLSTALFDVKPIAHRWSEITLPEHTADQRPSIFFGHGFAGCPILTEEAYSEVNSECTDTQVEFLPIKTSDGQHLHVLHPLKRITLGPKSLYEVSKNQLSFNYIQKYDFRIDEIASLDCFRIAGPSKTSVGSSYLVFSETIVSLFETAKKLDGAVFTKIFSMMEQNG